MNKLFFQTLFLIVFSFNFVFSQEKESEQTQIDTSLVLKKKKEGLKLTKYEKGLIRELRKKEREEALLGLPLDRYLQVTQNIQVKGQGADARFIIRGGSNTFLADGEPLFVLNGQIIDSFNILFDTIDVANIKNVNILKTATETSFYGARGSNGVIEIVTK